MRSVSICLDHGDLGVSRNLRQASAKPHVRYFFADLILECVSCEVLAEGFPEVVCFNSFGLIGSENVNDQAPVGRGVEVFGRHLIKQVIKNDLLPSSIHNKPRNTDFECHRIASFNVNLLGDDMRDADCEAAPHF